MSRSPGAEREVPGERGAELPPRERVPEEELRELQARGIRLVRYRSDGYPQLLTQLVDPPLLLYLFGPLELAELRSVAIVGTRRATQYGRRLAREITRGLVEARWTIVSGMARGIDGVAHAAALDAGGTTIGVLGSGLDHEYPASHRPLYRRMRRSGLLVSEFAPSVRPAPGLFPRRNRIIAALASAVVVVQAPARSGALITAGHGLDLGRDVLAVPGPVGLDASVGVHRLLRDGAAVATSAADVIEQIQATAGRFFPPAPECTGLEKASSSRLADPLDSGSSELSPAPQGSATARLSRVRDRLSRGPASADELIREVSAPTPEGLALLGTLEAEGILQREPDGRYVLSSLAGGRS